MPENDDLEPLWDALRQAVQRRRRAELDLKKARDVITARLCTCYREDEEWESRAVWCSQRMLNSCPYFIEALRRKISE